MSGQIVPTSDLAAMRYALENTGCIDVVEEGMGAPVRLEGTAASDFALGFGRWTAAIAEAFTLLPIVGLPWPEKVEGSVTARLYLNGHPIRSYESRQQFPYWTTLYSYDGDQSRALTLVRMGALRDLADQVAADLCGK